MEVGFRNLNLDNSSEELFVFQFHEPVSTLQNIASHTVALQLWHHYLSRAQCGKLKEKADVHFITVFNLDEDYDREFKKLPKLLKTPQRIEEMLKKSLEKIVNKTERWLKHFSHVIFGDEMIKYFPYNFNPNHIVWRQNDEIDYKRSASNMLTEGKLNPEQKFIVMCAFGMTEELEKFPINSLPEYFCLLGISDLKVAYWISYHRPELREIWVTMPDVIRPENTSIHVTMAMECASLSLPYAFEYFWSRLNEHEQTLVAVIMLPHQWKLLKTMLSTMSSFRQLQLVDQIPVELMSTFFIKGNSAEFCRPMPENALMIWTLVKDRITEQEFVKFLENVCYNAMGCEEYMVILIKIWDTASDRLKRHIVENCPDIFFYSFMRCFKYSPSSYKFFMKFLPLVNEHTRKKLYLALNAGDITSKYDIDILNLCLPEEADQLQLKNQIMESGDLVHECAVLLSRQKFDDVIARVTFFSPNAHDAREFFKKVLESGQIYNDSFIVEYELWNKLCNFMDTVFTNDFSTISRLKKHLVSSLAASDVFCWYNEEYFNVLVKITEQVFSPEEMKSFKRTLLEHFREKISSLEYWYFFKERCYNTFVSWCSGDENQIVDFKSIVPIDAFFDNIFRDICSSPDKNPQYLLNTLNDFLSNFCVDNEEVELVKIRKYYERNQYWINEVRRIFGGESETQARIFNWFLSFDF